MWDRNERDDTINIYLEWFEGKKLNKKEMPRCEEGSWVIGSDVQRAFEILGRLSHI